MRFQNATFITTVSRVEDIPSLGDLPEIALIGRSNVGKSSLLNTLTGGGNLAKTSSTPGKTRFLNFFNIDEKLICVDLPGYGYANLSHEEQKKWGHLIEGYLTQRSQLKLLLFLLDIRRDPSGDDLKMLEWIQHHHIPTVLILTKVDKTGQSEKALQTRRISSKLGNLPYLHTSATHNIGRKELICKIHEMIS